MFCHHCRHGSHVDQDSPLIHLSFDSLTVFVIVVSYNNIDIRWIDNSNANNDDSKNNIGSFRKKLFHLHVMCIK